MQKVWIDHTIWKRSYIGSAISDRADQKDVLDRLMRNQQDIGDVFKLYYGEALVISLCCLLLHPIFSVISSI
ncbi:hypothetical protein PAAL66ix_17837 [Paenibacillus alvei A6-6i-x]|nr:hypothetical protein PAAL66ix_17837 [Paenibacillus alvei A6-6i-x]